MNAPSRGLQSQAKYPHLSSIREGTNSLVGVELTAAPSPVMETVVHAAGINPESE